MTRDAWGSPPLNGEGAAHGRATPSEMRLATQPKANAQAPGSQEPARVCEHLARLHALAALPLGGALAVQEVALSRHYAGRAVSLMRERRQ